MIRNADRGCGIIAVAAIIVIAALAAWGGVKVYSVFSTPPTATPELSGAVATSADRAVTRVVTATYAPGPTATPTAPSLGPGPIIEPSNTPVPTPTATSAPPSATPVPPTPTRPPAPTEAPTATPTPPTPTATTAPPTATPLPITWLQMQPCLGGWRLVFGTTANGGLAGSTATMLGWGPAEDQPPGNPANYIWYPDCGGPITSKLLQQPRGDGRVPLEGLPTGRDLELAVYAEVGGCYDSWDLDVVPDPGHPEKVVQIGSSSDKADGTLLRTYRFKIPASLVGSDGRLILHFHNTTPGDCGEMEGAAIAGISLK